MNKLFVIFVIGIFLNRVRGQQHDFDVSFDEDIRDSFGGPTWVNQFPNFGQNPWPGNPGVGSVPSIPQVPSIPGIQNPSFPSNIIPNIPPTNQIPPFPGSQSPSLPGIQNPSLPNNQIPSSPGNLVSSFPTYPSFGQNPVTSQLPGSNPQIGINEIAGPVGQIIGMPAGPSQGLSPSQIFGQNNFNFPSNFPGRRQDTSTFGSEGISSTQSPAVRDCITNCPVTPEYNPVCGTDSVTYDNPGRLSCAQACGINVRLLRASRCTIPEQ